MIDIVIRDGATPELLEPIAMLDSGLPYGTLFRQYVDGEPEDTYYLTCGFMEKRVITLWYSEEERKHLLSTDNKNSLKELLPHVRVAQSDASVVAKIGSLCLPVGLT